MSWEGMLRDQQSVVTLRIICEVCSETVGYLELRSATWEPVHYLKLPQDFKAIHARCMKRTGEEIMEQEKGLTAEEKEAAAKMTGRYSEHEIAALLFASRTHGLNPLIYIRGFEQTQRDLRDYRTAQSQGAERIRPGGA